MKLFILFISLLSLALSACTNEAAMPPDDKGSSNVTIRIQPPRSITPPATRAESGEADAEAESKITSLTIRIASEKGDIGICRFSEATGDLPPVGEDGVITLSPQMKMNLDNLGDNNTVYVYANKEDETISILTNEDELWNEGKVKPLVMSGKSPLTVNGSSYQGTVALTRQLAKVEVRMSLSEDCVPSNLIVHYDKAVIWIQNVADRSGLYEHRDDIIPENIYYNVRREEELRKVKDSSGNYIPGRVIDYSYVNEQYPLTDDNEAPSFRGLTRIIISVPVTDPTPGKDMPGNILKTFDIQGDGDGILRRNHVYSLDVKILSADKMSNMFIIADWDSTFVSGMEGSFLNINETEIRMPADEGGQYVLSVQTDAPNVTLEYDTNAPDQPVEMEYRQKVSNNAGFCDFRWKNNTLPDYNIDIPLYLVAGNVRKKIRLLYTAP